MDGAGPDGVSLPVQAGPRKLRMGRMRAGTERCHFEVGPGPGEWRVPVRRGVREGAAGRRDWEKEGEPAGMAEERCSGGFGSWGRVCNFAGVKTGAAASLGAGGGGWVQRGGVGGGAVDGGLGESQDPFSGSEQFNEQCGYIGCGHTQCGNHPDRQQ